MLRVILHAAGYDPRAAIAQTVLVQAGLVICSQELYAMSLRAPETCLLRPGKYMHHAMEQEHRLVKHRVNSGVGYGAFCTAPRTMQGDAAMHRRRKGQIEAMAKRDVLAQNRVINQLFGLVA